MIRIECAKREPAVALANHLCWVEGIKVAVYRASDGDGFLLLDREGCQFEDDIAPLKPRRIYNPERRKTSRMKIRVPVFMTADAEPQGA